MGWLIDASMFAPKGSHGAGWSLWLVGLNQVSHLVMSAAYLSMTARFLMMRHRLKKSELIRRPIQQILIVVVFGVIVHLSNSVAFYWPNYYVFTLATVVGAICASALVVKLPRAIEALADQNLLEELQNLSAELMKRTARVSDEESSRYQRLKERVHLLEDQFQRSDWIARSRSAMGQLNDLLADLESVVNEKSENRDERIDQARRGEK